jgi:hypothetical protein
MRVLCAAAVVATACSDDEPLSAQKAQAEQIQAACEKLPVAECRQTAGCHVNSGLHVVESQGCLGERADLGCWSASGTCADQLPAGTDERGQSWVFDNTCVPADLRGLEDPRVLEKWLSWPRCSE